MAERFVPGVVEHPTQFPGGRFEVALVHRQPGEDQSAVIGVLTAAVQILERVGEMGRPVQGFGAGLSLDAGDRVNHFPVNN